MIKLIEEETVASGVINTGLESDELVNVSILVIE